MKNRKTLCSVTQPRKYFFYFRWKVCSTGFTYDFSDTCSCIPAPSRTASGGLTFVILLVGVYAFLTTVIVSYYRRKLRRQRLHSDSNLERLLREAFVDDPRSTATVVNAEGNLSGSERWQFLCKVTWRRFLRWIPEPQSKKGNLIIYKFRPKI